MLPRCNFSAERSSFTACSGRSLYLDATRYCAPWPTSPFSLESPSSPPPLPSFPQCSSALYSLWFVDGSFTPAAGGTRLCSSSLPPSSPRWRFMDCVGWGCGPYTPRKFPPCGRVTILFPQESLGQLSLSFTAAFYSLPPSCYCVCCSVNPAEPIWCRPSSSPCSFWRWVLRNLLE